MTYAPASIKTAVAYWVAKGGLNSGIVGDAAHRARATYHNGQEAIAEYGRTSANDYSIRTARDKEPFLTDAASALDINHPTKTVLRAYSRWLVEWCRKNQPGTSDVREVIYSPDGTTVWRYDRERGYNSVPVKSEYVNGKWTQGDQSHLWHTHISFYRDSEARSKVGLFNAYPPFNLEATDMPVLVEYFPGRTATVKAQRNVRVSPSKSASVLRLTSGVEAWSPVGYVKGDFDTTSDLWLVQWGAKGWEYTTFDNLATLPVAPADATPYAQADIDAAVAANEAKWEAWTATHP